MSTVSYMTNTSDPYYCGYILTFYTEGEFHVDLYTLPEPLVKMLWDFVSKEGRV